MNKLTFLFFFCLTSITSAIGQENQNSNFPIERVYKLSDFLPNSKDEIQVKILDSVLKNKEILLLGDPTHLEGNVSSTKIKLIDFLHKNYGFNIVLFEDSFYRLSKFDTALNQSDFNEYFGQTIANNNEFADFLNFLSSIEEKNSFHVLGFDSQILENENSDLIEDLTLFLSKSGTYLNDQEKEILNFEFSEAAYFPNDGNPIPTAKREADFFNVFTKIENSINEISDTKTGDDGKNWRQILANISALFDLIKSNRNINGLEFQNFRDSLMYENFAFLKNKFPNSKVIGWGASYHFAKNLELFSPSRITDSLAIEMGKKSGENSSFDYNFLSKGKPMGNYLAYIYKEKMYSLAFTTASGEYGRPYDKNKYQVVSPPENSFENHLLKNNNFPQWVDFDKSATNSPFYLSALGHLPILSQWAKIFDGVIFLPSATPLSPLTLEDQLSQTDHEKINSRVVDVKTNQPIPYCNIYVKTKGMGTVTNENGRFEFAVNQNIAPNDSIRISAIGYKPNFLSYASLRNLSEKGGDIFLAPTSTLLNEFTVTSSRIPDAEEIVKAAVRNKKNNLNRQPFQLGIYYTKTERRDNELINDIESVVDVYSKDGYQKEYKFRQYAQNHLAKINQSINHVSGKASGIPLLQLYYFDILADDDGVMSRNSQKNYKFELLELSNYESDSVYVIGFSKENNLPGNHNNYIKRHKGKLFINMADMALIKYEAEYLRDLSNSTSEKADQIFSIISTYQKSTETYYLKSGKFRLKSQNEYYDEIVTEEKFLTVEIQEAKSPEVERNLFWVNAELPIFNPKLWKNHKLLKVKEPLR